MFDLFNKRNLEEKEREISSLNRALEGMNDEIRKLRAQEKTGHKVGDHCKSCVHCAEVPRFIGPGIYTGYICTLDISCKDYKRKAE